METAMTPAGTARPPETDFSLRVLRAVAETVIAHAEELTALDQAIGDGDHGINMKRGLEAVLAACPEFEGQPPGEVLKAAGMKLVMKVGGASGPLYGTLAMELGKRVPASPSRGDWAAALAAAIEAVKTRGKSDVGPEDDARRPRARSGEVRGRRRCRCRQEGGAGRGGGHGAAPGDPRARLVPGRALRRARGSGRALGGAHRRGRVRHAGGVRHGECRAS